MFYFVSTSNTGRCLGDSRFRWFERTTTDRAALAGIGVFSVAGRAGFHGSIDPTRFLRQMHHTRASALLPTMCVNMVAASLRCSVFSEGTCAFNQIAPGKNNRPSNRPSGVNQGRWRTPLIRRLGGCQRCIEQLMAGTRSFPVHRPSARNWVFREALRLSGPVTWSGPLPIRPGATR